MEKTPGYVDSDGPWPEPLLQRCLGAPKSGRLHAGRRGQMLADGLEDLADEALRSPVCQGDLAAGTANTQKLGHGLHLVGREHHPKGRHHGVEAAVVKRQGLGIGDPKVDGQALRRGPLPALVQQALDIVRRGDLAEPPGRGQSDISVAGGDVQHLGARAQVHGFAELLADNLQGGADQGIVAGGPGGALLFLCGG